MGHTQQNLLGHKEVQCNCTIRASFPVPASRQQWTNKRALCWFCKSYSKEAHICVASSGHAPEVLGTEILSDEWLMVVMQYVNGSSWDEAIGKPIAELQAAVLLLHEAGFVHGDLCSNNILVVSGTACIIDFEWLVSQAGLCTLSL